MVSILMLLLQFIREVKEINSLSELTKMDFSVLSYPIPVKNYPAFKILNLSH